MLKILLSCGCFFLHLPLLLLNPLPHLCNHLLQQHFALLLRLGIDRMHLTLTLGVGRRIAALKEVIVELVDPAGAGLLHFALVRCERWAYGRFSVLGGKLVVQRLVGLIRLAVADPALDLLRGLLLHGAGDVAVDVDGGCRGDMSDDGGERFLVHAVLQGGCGEGMAQVVEADVLALRPRQHLFHLPIDALRIQRIVFFYR